MALTIHPTYKNGVQIGLKTAAQMLFSVMWPEGHSHSLSRAVKERLAEGITVVLPKGALQHVPKVSRPPGAGPSKTVYAGSEELVFHGNRLRSMIEVCRKNGVGVTLEEE